MPRALEAAHEGAAVEQAGEGVVVGQEAQLAEMPSRDECGGGVVREDPQRLEPVGRRHEPVARVVDPDDPEQRAAAVAERDDQPVAVPGPRSASVELRRVDVDVAREPLPRLVVGEEVATLPLELVVEQRLDLRDADRRALPQLVELPAGRRVRHDALGGRVVRLRRDVLEVRASRMPTQTRRGSRRSRSRR
jgi:hypothetical protein